MGRNADDSKAGSLVKSRMASAPGVCELEEVVGGADHRPLASDLVEAAEQELSEASGLLDLAEDGLDDLYSQAVAGAG